MKRSVRASGLFRVALVATVLVSAPVWGQSWEVGGLGGFGLTSNNSISAAGSSAAAGLGSGVSYGGVVTHHMYERISGDLRYSYRTSDLELSNGGQNVGFKARSHMVHYDVLYHFTSRRAKIRPFVAGGGGVRAFRGVGAESAFQPLDQFALLTRTQEYKPMISAGAGLAMDLNDKLVLRVEFRDFITPFPKGVITPAPGAKVSGWLHDFVPMVGISYRFQE